MFTGVIDLVLGAQRRAVPAVIVVPGLRSAVGRVSADV